MSEIELCKHNKVNEDLLLKLKEDMPSKEILDNLSDLFKVLGDQTRIKIIHSISKQEMCVCEIAEFLGMTQSAISHQLRVLKSARLVKFRKEGKTVYYSLDDDHVNKIFDFGLEHVKERYY